MPRNDSDPEHPDSLTFADCNGNSISDSWDISQGTSEDCQPDGVPDECQIGGIDGEVVWDNGLPNDDDSLALEFGPQPEDAMAADDITLPTGGIIRGLQWMVEQEPLFDWAGRVRVEVYPHSGFLIPPFFFFDGGYGPDDSAGPVAALWVPDDAGEVTRTDVGPGTVAERYRYDVSGLEILLPPGTWWVAVSISGGSDPGEDGRAFWVTSRTETAEPLLDHEAHVRAPGAGVYKFTRNRSAICNGLLG